VHLDGHLQRLLDSCKIYRIDCPYTKEELAAACFEVVQSNNLSSCYIRPMVMRGYGAPGMDGVGSPIETYVPAWEWGAYLGAEGFRDGIDCCTASYARPAPNTFPGMAKAAGNYSNAALIKMESQANGYAEAVALDASTGMVSEGSGQNIFVVKDGAIITPPINGSNLSGLTREHIILYPLLPYILSTTTLDSVESLLDCLGWAGLGWAGAGAGSSDRSKLIVPLS
jgi:branched-chain amino acid aminotransferase